MITYEWRSTLEGAEADEVRALVSEAAEYDEEAGFARVVPLVGNDRPAGASQLVVRIRPPEGTEEWPLAAYLRVDVSSDGIGTVQLAVRPEFRSLGVATLVFERLGWDTSGPGGWAGTGARGLEVWAYGDHPAADRMANRFHATRISELWKLVKPLRGKEDQVPNGGITVRPGADAGARHRVLVSPRGHEHLMPGSQSLVAVNGSDEVLGELRWSDGVILSLSVEDTAPHQEVGRALLARGLRDLRESGVAVAQMYVDSADEAAVRLSRDLSFQHDRSDVCYRLA